MADSTYLKLEIKIIQDCFRNGLLRELRAFQYFRIISHDQAGYFNRLDVATHCKNLQVSRSTYYRLLRSLSQLGWIVKAGRKYRIQGVRYMREFFGVTDYTCTRIDLGKVCLNLKQFKAFCLAAFIIKETTQYKKFKTYQAKKLRGSRKCSRDDLKGVRFGRFALSLIKQKLNLSISSASELRNLAQNIGLIKLSADHRREYGKFLLKDITAFKIGHPEVADFVKIAKNAHKKVYAYVNDTYIVQNIALCIEKRGTRYASPKPRA